MSTLPLVLTVFALALLVFGTVFIVMGSNGERGYWSQRDPSGDARADAVTLGAVAKNVGHYATGEVRAPLRLMAIGLIMWWAGLACAVVGLIVSFL